MTNCPLNVNGWKQPEGLTWFNFFNNVKATSDKFWKYDNSFIKLEFDGSHLYQLLEVVETLQNPLEHSPVVLAYVAFLFLLISLIVFSACVSDVHKAVKHLRSSKSVWLDNIPGFIVYWFIVKIFLYLFWNLISIFIYLFVIQIFFYLFLNLFSIVVYLMDVLVPFGSYLLFFMLSIIFWKYLNLSYMTVFHINSVTNLIPVNMDLLNLIMPLPGLLHNLSVSFHWFILSFKLMPFVLNSAMLLTQFHMCHCFENSMLMDYLLIM
jgi:hypothetical protein